jgi:dihydrofolate reductase
MRKLVLFMHTSLDGFVAGPAGEMDWINIDNEMFEYARQRTEESDTALYGRVTYELMESYWPTAAEQPHASKHDIEHSAWYNHVHKVIVSKTIQGTDFKNTKIISDNLQEEILDIKNQDGREIIMFGSPSVARQLMEKNLIDEYWLFVNPLLLGHGLPLFTPLQEKIMLKLISSETFPSGVVCLHYTGKEE